MRLEKRLIDPDSFLKESFNGVIIFFIVTRLFSFLTGFYGCPDITLYNLVAINIFKEDLALYKDFSYEYPFLTIIPIYFASLLSGDLLDIIIFNDSFSLVMMVADVSCLVLTYRYCKFSLKFKQTQLNQLIFLYSLLSLTMGSFLLCRFDVVVSLFLILSLVLFSKNYNKTLNFLCIFGFFYKIVTIFVIPISLLFNSFQKDNLKKSILSLTLNSLLYLSALILFIVLAEYFFDQKFISNVYNYHHERGIQIESVYSSILMARELIFGVKESIFYSYGSFNITANENLISFSKLFGFVILFLFYVFLFFILCQKKYLNQAFELDNKLFFEAILLTFLIIISFQRVLSIQFFIWIIPLISIYIIQARSHLITILSLVIFAMNFYIYPLSYIDLTLKKPFEVLILLSRNFLLISLTIIIAYNFFKKVSK